METTKILGIVNENVSSLRILKEISTTGSLNNYMRTLTYQLTLGRIISSRDSIVEALNYLGIKIVGRSQDIVTLADDFNVATVECLGFNKVRYNFNTLKIN